MTEKTIFRKIIDREIPADIVYEDDLCLAFNDINPQAPTHVLVIPKQDIPSTNDLTPEDRRMAGHLLWAASHVAQEVGLDNGYRLVLNCGPHGGQEVNHIHVHVLGGRQMTWPPG
jgi:histidine triad (HIT) family protein